MKKREFRRFTSIEYPSEEYGFVDVKSYAASDGEIDLIDCRG